MLIKRCRTVLTERCRYFTMKTYVHASDDDLKQGRQALARIHRII